MHLQGVYTWHKSIRATLKLPLVLSSDLRVGEAGTARESDTDRGVGDPIIALPLKRYFNLDGRSGSWTLAPQLRLPLGTTHGYDRLSGTWAGALFGGYETETYDYIVGGSLGAWASSGDQEFEFHMHFGGGPNWRWRGFSGHLKLKADVVVYSKEEVDLALVPVFYMRITDLVHLQLKTKNVVSTIRPDRERSRTDSFRIGLGLVY